MRRMYEIFFYTTTRVNMSIYGYVCVCVQRRINIELDDVKLRVLESSKHTTTT